MSGDIRKFIEDKCILLYIQILRKKDVRICNCYYMIKMVESILIYIIYLGGEENAVQ